MKKLDFAVFSSITVGSVARPFVESAPLNVPRYLSWDLSLRCGFVTVVTTPLQMRSKLNFDYLQCFESLKW